ncbi:MAG: hypothetical protein IKS19_04435 [Clostridia bacterium]|nr:hypothetical protein [Clostridia bacterium]
MLILKAKRNARRFAAMLFIIIFALIWIVFIVRAAKVRQLGWNLSMSDYLSVMKYSTPGDMLDRDGKTLLKAEDGKWTWSSRADKQAYSTLIGPDVRLSAFSRYTMLGASVPELLGVNERAVYNPLNLFKPTAVKGSDVLLTVDGGLQNRAVELLEDFPKSSIFMYNYMSGEVYTSVSKPFFDPVTLDGLVMDENDRYMSFSEPDGAGINKNIAYLRPPGSTMKTVTAAIALDYDSSLKDFSCECTGTATVNGIKIKCHSTHDTVENMAEALDKSCNIYFATLASKIPDDVYFPALKDYGFNDVITYGRYNVADGIFGTPDREGSISDTDKLLGSFGQATCRTTPLQMAVIYGHIASSGSSVLPYFFTADGKEHKPEPVHSVFNACTYKTCETLGKMLEDSVDDGSGSKAFIKGMHVMGKSGTAQWGDSRKDTAWFIAAIQNDSYPVVVAVCLDETSSSGTSAAPIARKMLQGAIDLIDAENAAENE